MEKELTHLRFREDIKSLKWFLLTLSVLYCLVRGELRQGEPEFKMQVSLFEGRQTVKAAVNVKQSRVKIVKCQIIIAVSVVKQQGESST